MNDNIQKDVEILWDSSDEISVDEKVEAFERIKSIATQEDLPQIVEYLQSDENDFWTRELLAEVITGLNGLEYLPELLEAKYLNEQEGHDNDGLNFNLTEMVEMNSEKSRDKLTELIAQPNFEFIKDAEWLLGFCK